MWQRDVMRVSANMQIDEFCWSDVSLEQGNVLRKVLGEPSDVGVGTLLVRTCITALVSCTVLYEGDAE